MPYVNQGSREYWKNDDKANLGEADAGDLNFLVTTMIDEWISIHGLNYANINTAVGVLECIKLELYRRIAAPYEDKKIEQNGDVYTCNLNQ